MISFIILLGSVILSVSAINKHKNGGQFVSNKHEKLVPFSDNRKMIYKQNSRFVREVLFHGRDRNHVEQERIPSVEKAVYYLPKSEGTFKTYYD